MEASGNHMMHHFVLKNKKVDLIGNCWYGWMEKASDHSVLVVSTSALSFFYEASLFVLQKYTIRFHFSPRL